MIYVTPSNMCHTCIDNTIQKRWATLSHEVPIYLNWGAQCQQGPVPVDGEPARDDAAVKGSTQSLLSRCFLSAVTHTGLLCCRPRLCMDYSRLERRYKLNHRLENPLLLWHCQKKKSNTNSASFCQRFFSPQQPQRTLETLREKLKLAGMDVCHFVWLTPCVAQFAACSYWVGWYLLLAGTLQFMNLKRRIKREMWDMWSDCQQFFKKKKLPQKKLAFKCLFLWFFDQIVDY